MLVVVMFMSKKKSRFFVINSILTSKEKNDQALLNITIKGYENIKHELLKSRKGSTKLQGPRLTDLKKAMFTLDS